MKRLKYAIADLLNRSRHTCWANLVTWIEWGTPLREVTDASPCKRDAARCGDCWCGKYWRQP